MGYKKQITTKQREERLIELIKDGKQMGFSKDLVAGFKRQLKEIQAELKADKEDVKKYKSNLLREQDNPLYFVGDEYLNR